MKDNYKRSTSKGYTIYPDRKSGEPKTKAGRKTKTLRSRLRKVRDKWAVHPVMSFFPHSNYS
ncbi:hypothetical protein BOTCAL_0194g00020 [Botryotinia calthae]|uniref:Uncharacterized protein n=1 Tax=Botryotinia calthae TaxID=38488 RepID=A0A4Y8D240_9HELO|nr:hypothetical protein BOTCAL_0194g00020 [Botryotinia calthae]